VIEALEARRMLAAGVPDFRKIVVVVEENHSISEIVGNSNAPYINALAAGGALFTSSFGVAHPSLPDYLALFSGSTQGVVDDGYHTFSGLNLDTQLKAGGKSFRGYAEWPAERKHDPWENFTNAAMDGRDMASFPATFANLPDVSFVSPNDSHNMHDGTIHQADDWLWVHLKSYADWAKANNSLLVVQWDEDDGTAGNHVATIFYGANVKSGRYSRHLDHYQVLATLDAAKGLTFLNRANTPITDTWTATPSPSAYVTSWQWMNGSTASQSISDGSIIAADGLAHGIRLNVSGGVGSVKFILSGANSFSSVENGKPFDLFHTAGDGSSNGIVWTRGSYALTVQLFSGSAASGTKLGEKTIHFSIS
jgi:phosphatidylinositol-3-phosphatase